MSNTTQTLEAKIERLEKRITVLKKEGKFDVAAEFEIALKNAQSQLAVPLIVEKKNDTIGNAATPVEQNKSVVDNSHLPVNSQSIEKLQKLKDSKFFETLEDAKIFSILRGRLRSKLWRFHIKANKTSCSIRLINLDVENLIEQIHEYIIYKALFEYVDFLKNEKTYSIGDKKNGDEKRYCFNIETLKKDFDF